jgi:hypothetical protein
MRTLFWVLLAGCGASHGGGGAAVQGGDADSDSDPAINPVVAAHDDLCETPEKMLGAWCEMDGDCCEGQACVSGQCAPPPDEPCADHDDCPVGFECVDGGCECVGEHCDDLDCPDAPPRLAASWNFDSRLDVSEAVADWILWIGDAAAVGCDWVDDIGWLAGLPAWAPDLLCLVADITAFMHDMEVEHLVRMTAGADDVTWTASDTWTHVTFDPDGDPVEIDPRRLECPVEVDDFSVRWSCGDTYLDRHEVHVPVDGLVKLALDSVACGAMGDEWGCSWDAAMDELCAGIDDPFLLGACEEIVDSLEIPDPCVDINTMTLAGTATSPADGSLVGNWAGTLDGGDFDGTFEATRAR